MATIATTSAVRYPVSTICVMPRSVPAYHSRMARLVVKITSGPEALERCNQGWAVATAALASGVEVSVWLTGDAVRFATPHFAATVTLAGAQPFEDAVAMVLDEGTLTTCTQCLGRRGLTGEDLLPGVRIAGSASFVEEIMGDDTRALVY